MKYMIKISAFVLLISAQYVAADSTYNVSSEAQQFKNDLNVLTEEVNQKIMNDANYSDKVKLKANEKLNN